LQVAIQSGNLEFCQKLQAEGCHLDVDLECGGCSALILAIQHGRFDIVKWLLENGATTTKVSCRHQGNGDPKMPLELFLGQWIVTKTGLIRLFIEKFLSDGGDIFQEGLALAASRCGNIIALNILLEYRKKLGTHPMQATENQISGEGYCRDNQLTRNNSGDELRQGILTTGSRPLTVAIKAGHVEAVELLLKHGTLCSPNSILCDVDYALPLASLSQSRRQTEIVKLLLNHGANIDRRWRDNQGSLLTPILLASKYGNSELVNLLLDSGADYEAVDLHGWSALHYAAWAKSPEKFAALSRKGASVHLKDRYGVSALHRVMSIAQFTAWILNSDIHVELVSPFPWQQVSTTCPSWITTQFRLYQKRLDQTVLQGMANMQPPVDPSSWSPLCLMSVQGNIRGMENLIELGASLDHEGSPHGSALMTACANRQLGSVELLVREKASLCYISSRPETRDQFMSCLEAARGSVAITNWLLVGRFTDEQRKIAPDSQNLEMPIHGSRAGITKAELVIAGRYERQPSESSREYFVRLGKIRADMRGRVVRRAPEGCKTCRPSRLVPEETVRIRPDDERVPKL
jgi:ankyrin repeat protein